jgi:WD40 repeat protein/tetratricopeptide (TPR) repeat protein
MGTVWVAEQTQPIRREVALKVIKLGMDTKQVIARFEAERQALALMDHPNIAKVLEAGATETGRPYFVMERVKGIPITDYCDRHNLPTGERLDLFVQVCHAIQHAHQKGIIHRDIKPSNILVGLQDGVPVPKVIDFGIAKATAGQRLTELTLHTALAEIIGTPAYMSPEQAEMTGLDIDTRSDIYSLGVLLYELLTGKTPFDARRLVKAGWEGVRRIIREEEPPRPSTRLSILTAEEQTTTAKHRHTDPPRLLHLVRGDLDWIVMKCLEKDRTRRYETANELATEIHKHLNNEPVAARPPSSLYRFQKLVRRNKLAFAAGAMIVAVLVLAVVVSSSLALIARRAERRAEAAATEARMALSTSDFLQACRFIAEDKDNDAVAYLVASLRANPANDAAVTRLATLLTCRTWLRPILDLQHAEPVSFTQFSPDGKRVVTVSTNVVRVWDAQTGQPLTEPLKHADRVNSAQFSPEGKRLVTASWDSTARVWDARTGQPLTEPLKHAGAVSSAQFSPDGKRVVTASYDYTARVWDAQTGQPLTEPLKHGWLVFSAQFSPDGKRLVTASLNPSARVWDAQTGQPVTEPLENDGQVKSAQFSPDGKRFVTGSFVGELVGGTVREWGTARVWDAQTGQPLTPPLKHARQVNYAQFSPDGKRVLTVSGEGVRLWDAQTGQPLTEPLKHAGEVNSAQFSPDGKRVVTASVDGTARVWDAQTGLPLTEPLKHADAVNTAHFSPDGKQVVTASDDHSARVWDAQTGHPLTDPLKHAGLLNCAQFSPDGKRVVTASQDGMAGVWDAQTGQPLTAPLKHAGLVSAQLSPDGKRVVTASTNVVRVWDAQTGQLLSAPLEHAVGLNSSQFSHAGILRASPDGTARVWDMQTGQPLTAPLKHAGKAPHGQWSPDRKRVVTASAHTARVWDAQTGQPLTEPLEHAGLVNWAQFSPDGKRVVTASYDGTARVWDAQTGQPLTDPLKHAGGVFSAQFSPDGKRILTASDNTARVWDVAPPSAGYPGWLLQLATAVCGEVLGARGVLEYTNQVQALNQLRQTLSEQPGSDDWLTLGRWLLADRSTRTISPFSRITVPEWIERRFKENMTNSLAELEQWAISSGDAVLLERVSHARPAVERAEAARAYARTLEEQRNGASNGQAGSLNNLAMLFAASPREDLRDGRIAVILAEKAVAATSRKDPIILDTLAAGLAEAGRFAEAARVQREALGLLSDPKSKEDYSSRLNLYETNSPYRDDAPNVLAPAADDRLGIAALLWTRGTLCAQFAQWTLAAGDLTKAVALNPDENLKWFYLAPLLLETEDMGGYRKHCHAMLARFGATNDPNIAQRTAKVCLLLPLDGADLAAATKLAETAVTLSKDDPSAAYYQFAKGLAEYRQTDFAQAVEWTQKALRQPDTDYNRDVQAYSVLAMALHRLNKTGEAREALSKATELAGAKLPRLDSGDLGPNWHNWIIAQTLLREAKVLIEGGAKAGDETKIQQ